MNDIPSVPICMIIPDNPNPYELALDTDCFVSTTSFFVSSLGVNEMAADIDRMHIR
jgi:hypothetical protein